MDEVQSPSPLLNVYEVLNAISINKLNKEIIRRREYFTDNQPVNKPQGEDFRRTYILYESVYFTELEKKLRKREFFFDFGEIRKTEVTIDRRGCNREFTTDTRRAERFEINTNCVAIPSENPLQPAENQDSWEEGSLKLVSETGSRTRLATSARISANHIEQDKIKRYLRRLLSGGDLDAHVWDYGNHHKMPPEFWHYDNNWYRLLADGKLSKGSPTAEDTIVATVYFKKDNLERCLSNNMSSNIEENLISYHKPQAFLPENSHSLINLNTYSTPWLQVLNAVYDEHGKNTLAQVSKISIESFMSDYIKKHELDIPPSDVPFLAKFIRLAEQREGKKYHAALKIKKIEAVSKE